MSNHERTAPRNGNIQHLPTPTLVWTATADFPKQQEGKQNHDTDSYNSERSCVAIGQ